MISWFHGAGSGLSESIVGDWFPSGLLADVGFFEEAGAVVFDDALQEKGAVSLEVFVPEDGNLSAATFEGIRNYGRTEFAGGGVFTVREDVEVTVEGDWAF